MYTQNLFSLTTFPYAELDSCSDGDEDEVDHAEAVIGAVADCAFNVADDELADD